jgi:hypothetical protein
VLVNATANAQTQADQLWRHRVKPILEQSWPKSSDKRTPEQSSELGELCAALDATFAEAVQTVAPLAVKANHLYRTLEELHRRHTAARRVATISRCPCCFPSIRLVEEVRSTLAIPRLLALTNLL